MQQSLIEFENDRVRVERVKLMGPSSQVPKKRNDRLIVYLRDAHIARTDNERREEIHRRAGDVVWQRGSEHQIDVLNDGEHEVLIIELKP